MKKEKNEKLNGTSAVQENKNLIEKDKISEDIELQETINEETENEVFLSDLENSIKENEVEDEIPDTLNDFDTAKESSENNEIIEDANEPEKDNVNLVAGEESFEEEKSETEQVGIKDKTGLFEKKSVFEDAPDISEYAEKTQKTKKSFKNFWKGLKKPVKVTIIISMLLIVLMGCLGIAHAIMTKGIVFIHDSEDLFKALEKGKGYVLYIKEDVVIDDDLTFNKGYDINLHGNTLTVKGKITYNLNTSEENVTISTITKKKNASGGAILADDFSFYGEKATLTVYSDLTLKTLQINAAKNVELKGKVNGKILLKDLVKNLSLSGSADSISGGNKVTLINGAYCAKISDTAKVIIQPQAKVDILENIEAAIFVEKLEAPKNIMIDTSKALDKILYFTFNKVVNADSYVIKIDQDTIVPVIKPSGENSGTYSEDGDKITVTYNAEQLVPNDYEVSIYAISSEDNKEMYLDSDVSKKKFTVSIQLPEPIIDNIDKENGKIILSYNQYVSSYIININNISFTVSDFSKDENNKVSIDISDKIKEVGSYSISVVAHSDHSYYSNSNPCYKSCVITKKLDTLVFNTVIIDEINNFYTFSWQEVEHAKYYKVKVTLAEDSTEYFTSKTNIVLTLDPTKEYTIEFIAVKNGYYLDSDPAVCPMDFVVPAPEEETDE